MPLLRLRRAWLLLRGTLLRADEVRADETTVRGRRCNDDLDLVRKLVGERLLDQQRMLGDERAFARHLLGIAFAHAFDAIGLGIRELLPRVGFTAGLDEPRLRTAFR